MLLAAGSAGRQEVVESLVTAGARTRITDVSGLTPLMVAILEEGWETAAHVATSALLCDKDKGIYNRFFLCRKDTATVRSDPSKGFPFPRLY